MGFEIERKYLVKNDGYRQLSVKSIFISQGYLCREPERTVRVRVKEDKGFLTVKGKNEGAKRAEFEYEVPLADAERLLDMCLPPILRKIRHVIRYEGHIWEVDEFLGERYGLVTAEIELSSEEECFSLPSFIGEEVTGNPAYYNSNL